MHKARRAPRSAARRGVLAGCALAGGRAAGSGEGLPDQNDQTLVYCEGEMDMDGHVIPKVTLTCEYPEQTYFQTML